MSPIRYVRGYVKKYSRNISCCSRTSPLQRLRQQLSSHLQKRKRKLAWPEQSPSKSQLSSPVVSFQVLVDDIDKQLGGFYGSMELRDALKEVGDWLAY